MTGEVESHRSRIIPIEHPERLMARLRGWDPVVDPFGTGLLRSFQCDMPSSFEPFTPPFTDTGYIRPQMLDNALFGYYTGNTASQSEQENVSAENVPRQPLAQLYDLSLMSASGVTGYIKSVLTGSEEKPTAEQVDNHTMDTVDLNSTQATTQEISQGSTDKITARRGTTYVDAKETISKTSDINSIQGTTQEISQGSTDKITARRGTTYVDAKETISKTSDTGSEIDKNNDISGQGTSRQDNDVIVIRKDAVESGKRKEGIAGEPGQTKNTGYMFDPTGVIPIPTGMHSMQHNTYEVLNTDMEFCVNMDVTHFKPEEIEIRVEGIKITVHGRHAEREDDHGLIEREFTRIYTMPPDADPDKVASSLYANGVLTVKAPKRNVAV